MKKFYLLYIVFLLNIPVVFCQSEVARLANKITEDISLTTDRDYYLSGEKVWFTAEGFVILDDAGNQLSNVLYLELFNESHKSFVKRKFRVDNGIVSGMFAIPSELVSGNYLLRIYTQYQRNSLPESFTTKYITIINPAVQLPQKLEAPKEIEILPEFGFLLSNQVNKVAVNLRTAKKSRVTKAWIEDSDHLKVTELDITNDMGTFQLIPKINTEYSLFSIKNKDTSITKLPLSRNQGVALRVSESNSNNQMDLAIIKQIPGKQQFKLGVYSKHFNRTSNLNIQIEEGMNHFPIQLSSLSKGFNYFVLRNSQNELVAIHSYFNFYEDLIDIQINPNQAKYSPRSKIELELSSLSNSEYRNLSISVAKKGSFLENSQSLPAFLLQNPILLDSYYHSNPDIQKSKAAEIEALLIKFNSHLSNNAALKNQIEGFNYNIDFVPEIRDVSLSGYVRNKNTKAPIKNANVYASVFKKVPQVHFYNTDENGFFIFSLNNLTETQDVFLSLNNNLLEGESAEFEVNTDFSTAFPLINPVPLEIDSSQIPFIEELYVNTQSSKIFNTEVGRVSTPSIKLPFSFMNAEFSIDLDEYVDSPSLEVIFKELVPSVKVKNKDDQYSLTVTDPLTWEQLSNPLIMVDYITIFDVNEVMAINPKNIKKINVYSTPFVLGNAQLNGVILITTKTDNFGGMKMPAESVFFEYTTLSNAYRFDPPSYETDKKLNNRKADFRNLLYWNGDLKLHSDNKVSFYASDHCSEYEVIVRGYTEDGRRCYGKAMIQVVK